MTNGIYISEDKMLLDTSFIHNFIKATYWGQERTLEETKQTLEHSLCVGVYTKKNKQIGFARVVTDYVLFGYIMDVFITDDYQGKGLGKNLVDFIINHKTISNLKTVALKTKDAHELYQKYGFQKIGDSPLWMAVDRQKLL